MYHFILYIILMAIIKYLRNLISNCYDIKCFADVTINVNSNYIKTYDDKEHGDVRKYQ